MPLIPLILVLAIIGFTVWLVVRFIPMPAEIKNLIVVVVVVILALYVLSLLFPGLATLRVGR